MKCSKCGKFVVVGTLCAYGAVHLPVHLTDCSGGDPLCRLEKVYQHPDDMHSGNQSTRAQRYVQVAANTTSSASLGSSEMISGPFTFTITPPGST